MEAQIREDRVPNSVRDGELHLLLSDIYQDEEIDHYRRREAAWMSAAVHIVVILLLLLAPKWIGQRSVVFVPMQQKEDTTFLELPRDELKVQAPRTNKISDQNRIAQTRTPSPTRDDLRKLLDARKPGPPARPAPQPAAVQPPVEQASQQPQAQPQSSAPAVTQPQPTQTAKM
ncbi:MAG: hypothetical protein ACRD4F_14955, partial [Candidatus Angelobacter sp.]